MDIYNTPFASWKCDPFVLACFPLHEPSVGTNHGIVVISINGKRIRTLCFIDSVIALYAAMYPSSKVMSRETMSAFFFFTRKTKPMSCKDDDYDGDCHVAERTMAQRMAQRDSILPEEGGSRTLVQSHLTARAFVAKFLRKRTTGG